MNRRRPFKKKTIILLVAAVVLLLGSAVGSTSAALTYFSENYVAEFETYRIDVRILENGNDREVLLQDLLGDDEELKLGKKYDEALSVENTGKIDSYVRVIVRKSWKDENGNKDTSLAPELIDLNFVTGKGWVIDKDASTPERTVLYYTDIVPVGAVTSAFTDTLRIDPLVGTKVTETVKNDTNGTTISYEYEYDGYSCHIDAEVDSVQTHNAVDAIKSAWGVDVNIAADGSLSLR